MGRFRSNAELALWIIVAAVAYFAAAEVGLRFALVGNQVTPLWPPTGVALACLFLFGLRAWPGITLGALAVNALLGPTLPAVLMIALGNTVAPVVAYLLLRRVGFRSDFVGVRDVLELVFLGALAAMLISATVGTVTLLVAGVVSAHGFWGAWLVWWTGDAVGVLLIAPLILIGKGIRIPKVRSPLRVIEAAMLAMGTFVVAVSATVVSANLLFLVFPFVTWAAMRFHLAGALPCALIASTVAIVAVTRDFPAFSGLDLTAKMITLQAFNGSVALTALIHATITAQRDRARRAVDDTCTQLAQTVLTISQGRPLEGVIDTAPRLQTQPPTPGTASS
ncbi:MASE1 domain-containing protein [Nocardia pseudovaccinii]|uniref:MASE1 domain-containing protein n=1 Tax=Nocardia pseudovaccinii TaxID=189540 RepID=UPI0007C699F8|nr:MASE1 domain-containing protein [Nocardia pseudovaccinii]